MTVRAAVEKGAGMTIRPAYPKRKLVSTTFHSGTPQPTLPAFFYGSERMGIHMRPQNILPLATLFICCSTGTAIALSEYAPIDVNVFHGDTR